MIIYQINIERISPSGEIIPFEIISTLANRRQAVFIITHRETKIGDYKCEVGDLTAMDKVEAIIKRYLKSDDFQKSRKEAGRWN